VTVVDAASTALSKVSCYLSPNGDWDLDEIVEFSISAQPSEESIDFCIEREGPIVGAFTINYRLE
jgi:hypothetical protein